MRINLANAESVAFYTEYFKNTQIIAGSLHLQVRNRLPALGSSVRYPARWAPLTTLHAPHSASKKQSPDKRQAVGCTRS